MTEEGVTLYRGLREVYIDRTTSSFINGKEGKLYYSCLLYTSPSPRD